MSIQPHSTTRFRRMSPELYARQAQSGLRTDMMTRAAYTSDASIFRRVPAAILEPENTQQIRDALAVAEGKGWSVVGRGGGSSVAGNAIGEGLVIDTSRYFNRILDIDADQRTATVEPGVVCDVLRAAVSEYGLTYGPDPSTHEHCTIGGMVSNNACGSHSIAYGTAAENLVDVTLMLADGREVTVTADGCDDPDIDAALWELYGDNSSIIDGELGRFPRQVSGYGLHYLADHAARAMAGSEGTLGIITRLTVKLVPTPKATALAVLAFDSVFDAAAAAVDLRLPGVGTIEGMGGDLLAALRSKQGMESTGENLPGASDGAAAGGWLFCETGADTVAAAEEAARSLIDASQSASPVGHLVVSEPEEMRALWRIREAAAGIVTRLPDGREAWPNWEDSAVPPEHLADYLRDLYRLMDQYGYEGIPFGHFGEGCVHVRISFDFATEDGIRTFHSFMNEAARLVTSYDGSLSGEHGDGRARSALLGEMYSAPMRRLFERFKLIFDPDRRFNPGVLVWADDVLDGLRVEPAQRALEITPVHSFSKDGGSMVNAVNRCVGVSACRSEEGAMCPSFQITGDEVHSTRGRARILSEMFRGETLPEGFQLEEVHDALDLCLSCKACASECPVNVDMATYKAEFLSEHYRGKVRPRVHYLMGWLPLLSYVAHRLPVLPGVVDKLLQSSVTAPILRRLGGLADRPLIRFAGTGLRRWQKRREPSEPAAKDNRETVVLWPDSFTSSLDTGPATAAVEVLEALGYTVAIPDGFVCCGLTWHSTGQLGMTEKVLEHTAKVMKPYLDRGLSVVGLEPSCTVMLHDEATELSDNPELQKLSEMTVPFAEVIAPKLRDMVNAGRIPPAQISALTQVHCHEQALGTPQHAKDLLEVLGIEESEISTGCCGLAGNWGFEPGHEEMSFALGERELFPKVRELAAADSDSEVIADGFSCRTHIEQGTGHKARHLAEVVRDLVVPEEAGR